MLTTSKIETGFIVGGRANGISRRYDGGCPHQTGKGVILATNGGEAYAACTIMSIRETTLDLRRSDDELAQRDGFSNSTSWINHWNEMYGPVDGKVYRLQLRIDEKLVDWK